MAYIQDWGMRVQAQPQINTTRRSFLHLSQNENGRMLNIRITDVNIPAGSTAVLAGTKPDGTVYSQAGTLAGNTATFAEDVQMTAVVGTWDAKITVTNGGNCICTARITITIDPDTVAGGAIPSDSQLDGIIAECRAIADSVRKEAYGSPLVADAVEDMTDQSRVYVYTGSESGMTAGHWYYYNGTAWADGGVYNAVAVDTDTTLSIAGKAADAKEVGDQLTSVKEDLQDLSFGRIALDMSDSVSAYASSTIGSVITFTSSSATYTFKKALAVEEGKQYQVSVKNGASLSSSNARTCVITDDTDIVRQVISLQSIANGICIIRFTAECDGWLYLCVDKQYVDIWAEGGVVYENTLVVNNDNTPDLTLGIKATVGVNYYISGGKIAKKTNNTARASSELFYIPDKYNYMMTEANVGYAVNVHRVNPLDDTAATVMWWARGTLILPVEHDMEYVVQGAMRDTTSTVVLPQDGTIAKLYLFRDLPNQWLCPMYSYDKQPQLDLIYYEAGNLSPQGIATDGKNILMCVPKGRMSLIDIKTKTVIKTITFSNDQYGHMNSVTYYNGNYYVPNMESTGEVYVFDAETLVLVDTIIPLDENGQPYAVWRFSYDKSTDRFYSAHTTVTQELYLIYDTSFNLVDTVQLSGSTTIDGSAQTYRQAMLVDKDYIYELNTSHDFAYNFIVIHKKTGEFVGIVQIDEITGHEMEGIAYDWEHDIMYISYTNRRADPYDRGFALMRMNLKSQPNMAKMLSYVADVL